MGDYNFDTSWVNADYLDKLKLKDAQFIFEQAEKLLKDINETNSLIVARTTTLITITVGFMLALIGFLFNRYSLTKDIFDIQLITSFLSFLYVLSSCRVLVKNIQGQDYAIVGIEPKMLLTENFFKDEIQNEEQRIIRFYINEAVVCQSKIDRNKVTNERRWVLFNKSLRRLLYTPAVIVLIYSIVKGLVIAFSIFST